MRCFFLVIFHLLCPAVSDETQSSEDESLHSNEAFKDDRWQKDEQAKRQAHPQRAPDETAEERRERKKLVRFHLPSCRKRDEI